MKTKLVLFAIVSLLSFSALSWGDNFLQTSAHRLLQMPKQLDSYRRLLKWGPPKLGAPALITYAIAQEPIDLPIDIGNCTQVEAFSVKLSEDSDPSQVFAEIHSAFTMWEQVTNLKFKRVDNPREADIVLGNSPTDLSFLHARVGLQRGPKASERIQSIVRGALCMNGNDVWTTLDRHFVTPEEKQLSLRLVIAHEVGHLLGLDHPHDKSQLMGKTIHEETRGLEAGDRLGIQLLYGRPLPAHGSANP